MNRDFRYKTDDYGHGRGDWRTTLVYHVEKLDKWEVAVYQAAYVICSAEFGGEIRNIRQLEDCGINMRKAVLDDVRDGCIFATFPHFGKTVVQDLEFVSEDDKKAAKKASTKPRPGGVRVGRPMNWAPVQAPVQVQGFGLLNVALPEPVQAPVQGYQYGNLFDNAFDGVALQNVAHPEPAQPQVVEQPQQAQEPEPFNREQLRRWYEALGRHR